MKGVAILLVVAFAAVAKVSDFIKAYIFIKIGFGY